MLSGGKAEDEHREGAIPTKTYRVITDHLGSPLMVVNVEDASDIWLEAEYDVWGKVTRLEVEGLSAPLSAWPIPFGYAGGLYDGETGLVRFGARDYDPTVGRWTSKDPILFGGGQSNLYVYVENDPVNFYDPKGTVVPVAIIGWKTAAWIIGGTAVSTGLAKYFWGDQTLGDFAFGAATGTVGAVASLSGSWLLGAVGIGFGLTVDTNGFQDLGASADTATGELGGAACNAASGPAGAALCPMAAEAAASACEGFRGGK